MLVRRGRQAPAHRHESTRAHPKSRSANQRCAKNALMRLNRHFLSHLYTVAEVTNGGAIVVFNRWKWIRARRAFAAAVVIVGGLAAATDAGAIPSMARQTGYTCAQCHTVFPELTPFGRQFKLGGYTDTSSTWDEKRAVERLPLSAGLQVSRTSTRSTSAGGTVPEDFPQDRKIIAQTVAGYWGGRVMNNVGALVQYNYDGIEKRWGMEMFDLRYANSRSFAGKELAWGITLNNSPTVSDIYNSTPSWGFPHTDTAARQMPAATLVDMTLASKVAGIGVYGMWDELLYVEVANYRSARSGASRLLSAGQPWNSDELAGSVVRGNSPYWRIALQTESRPHSFAVGAYGLSAKVWQDVNNPSLGSNRFRDIAVDANYQYAAGNHIGSARATLIREKQTFSDAVLGVGGASNPSDTLKTFRVDTHYYYRRKWGGGVQYFRTTGSIDNLRYNSGDALLGSTSGSPNSKGWITELNWLPRENIKLGVRYTAYLQFNGARTAYTPGRNASDNNSLYLYGWLLF